MKCACHEIEFAPGETAWLKEDGTILCEDGNRDEHHDDPFDYNDHGTAYDAAYLERIERGRSLPKGHPLRLALLYGSGPPTRLVEDPDAGFEAARARITTPNHERNIA